MAKQKERRFTESEVRSMPIDSPISYAFYARVYVDRIDDNEVCMRDCNGVKVTVPMWMFLKYASDPRK